MVSWFANSGLRRAASGVLFIYFCLLSICPLILGKKTPITAPSVEMYISHRYLCAGIKAVDIHSAVRLSARPGRSGRKHSSAAAFLHHEPW